MVERDDQVADAARLRIVELDFERVSVQVFAVQAVRENRSFTLLEGRAPVDADEVVLGPATARALDRTTGDSVRIGGSNGRDARVVGIALLPQTPHFSFDQGAWMSGDGFDAVVPVDDGENLVDETVVIRFRPGQPTDRGIARLQEQVDGPEVEPIPLPQDVAYLRNVPTLPKALAGFLVLLGLGATGHVLATAVRRRRHDLAVLRALGFRPLQVASCVAWLAITVAVVALALGIPLGVAAGRWSWRLVADATPLLYVAPVAATVILAAAPASLVLANLMAALPARKAARLRPADVLRAE